VTVPTTRRVPALPGRDPRDTTYGATDTPDRTPLDGSDAVVGIGPVDAIGTPLEAGRLRPTVVRLTGDVEALAADLLDRLGPAAVTVLAAALLALAGEVRP
jgi:hypothetical protein